MRRQNWEEVKKRKQANKALFSRLGIQMPEPQALLAKAARMAELLRAFSFVRSVGLFGSAARGEAGLDIDIIVFDDGTVSDRALKDIQHHFYRGGSAGTYAHACHLAFLQHMPGEGMWEQLDSPFYQAIREEPSVDLVFVDCRIQYDQEYLDHLVWVGMPDPGFFRNIAMDTLLYRPGERNFQKSGNFPNFVNKGIPGRYTLRAIQEQMLHPYDYEFDWKLAEYHM